uniref:Retrotransposon Copia-like N-terminal domain-containing protein n=1 Tax=Cannabis sativa TaxID=3483 RepID=A0A803QNN8_CANSA
MCNEDNGDTTSDPIPNPEITSAPIQQASMENRDRPAHEDLSSPYFLSTGDHPGLVLVSAPLTGPNFQSWRRAISMAFAAKNKTAFLDGSLPKPIPSDHAFCSWTRCNNMNDLIDRFNEGNGPRIFQLKAELHSIQQGDQSISSYFTKLQSLWDELKEFQPIANCTCGALQRLQDFYNMDQVLQFLTGLNESYNSVRAQILLIEPLPSISKVFSMVVQEERLRTLGSGRPPMAAATQPSNPPRSKKPRPSCSHCHKPGHLAHQTSTSQGSISAPSLCTEPNPALSTPPPDLTTHYQQLISFLSQQLQQQNSKSNTTSVVAATNLTGTPNDFEGWDG